MPYKISGTKSHTARIIVLKESDWSIESNTVVSGSGAYEIDSLVSGTKAILSRNSDGWVKGYGNVIGEYYASSRGVFAGGYTGSDLNTIDYITLSSIGNANDFGDLTAARNGLAATSNA